MTRPTPGTAALPSPAVRTEPPRTPRLVLPEIQALRALAVALVVLHHLWPSLVPGGFVGVDVFFAISGYLITDLLLRELDRVGTISLGAFWARRARRLLPAAFLVVAACIVATVTLVPFSDWQRFFADMRAGVLYVENWHLAADAVDYFAADDGPSPVQHFWTLSAEEQFYLVWPLLVIVATVGFRAVPTRARIALVLGAATLAGLGYALHATAATPATAYFGTPARAWEFGAGGLLALAGGASRGAGVPRTVLCWLGLAAIGLAALTFDGDTPFPGPGALLPVLGAIAVMRAGAPPGRAAPTRLMRLRPVQGLGAISYSVYLWHWPLLVFAPYALGHAVGPRAALAILALTILAATLTKRLVEDPVRSGALTRRPPAATLVLAAAASAVLVTATLGGRAEVRARVADDERATRAALTGGGPRCFGAASADPRHPCVNPALRKTVVPAPVSAPEADNAPCTMIERRDRLRVCAFGASPGMAQRSVAVVGDSHASHWRAALAPVARAERWRGLSLTRTGCPFTAATLAVDEPARSNCRRWNAEVRRWLALHPEVHTVIVTARTGLEVQTPEGGDGRRAVTAGFATAWDALPPSVRRIVVLRDTPRMRAHSLGCIERAIADGRAPGPACAVPRERALAPDPQLAAAVRVRSRRVDVVDLTRVFCDERRCLPVIGGALAFKDEDHLTPTFAATLAPQLRRALATG